ncbi:MAG: class I SAM-dependent methyltransferase [Planctomycetota bacterium]|jgi:SAM-dependent methyltransferase
MSPSPPAFDAAAYKSTTRDQWDSAADAWHRWGGLLNTWLGPSTETMFDMAGIGPGSRVLDVAAGAGEQTMAAAARVGAEGHVLATDLSEGILACAAAHAAELGHDQVATQVLDGEELHTLPADSFDAVISRVGMIYFPDQQKALAGMKHALRDGGKVAAMVYSTAEKNGFFSVPVSIIRRHANLGPPAPGQPGPFSLGGEGALRAALEQAGFRDVEDVTIDAPVRVPTAAECLAFEKESFGALHQMLGGLSDSEKAAAWSEVEEALRAFEGPNGFEGPCEMIVAVGTK